MSRFRPALNRFHKFLQCIANLIRRIFLQEMHAFNCDFSLVRPAPAEFEYTTPDDGPGLAYDEELGQGTLRHCFPKALHNGCNIGRFTLDRDLTWPN